MCGVSEPSVNTHMEIAAVAKAANADMGQIIAKIAFRIAMPRPCAVGTVKVDL